MSFRSPSSQRPTRAPSFASEASTPFDPSSSRQSRLDSLRLPPLIEGRTQRNFSIASSGTSTPSTRKRRPARKDSAASSNDKLGQVDWADVEPDEVFKRLPVQEVKRVEAKMRTDALNKQSELRSMVGTRYRDLLTSATQITSLRSSSLRLSSSLQTIVQTCSNPSDIAPTIGDTEGPNDEEDVMSVLPVAAHVKLLLDAPEALYAYLSHHAYLSAAYLWLVARVVKENLSSMPEEASGPYVSLQQKQWETLLPFRNQIITRATASLRTRERLDAKTLSETILAIILLDNLPLSEALNLFFTQRTKALRDILNHPASPTSPHNPTFPPTVIRNRRRTNSKLEHHDSKRIAKTLSEAVQSMLDTAQLARAVLDKRRKLSDESLVEELVRLVQKGEPAAASSSMQATRHASHERRASRLASISLPFQKLSNSSEGGPPVSAQKVIHPLPSSQILLQHLPTTITGFTPFIAPSTSPRVGDDLAVWQNSSTKLLADSVPSWLLEIESISEVWGVRATLEARLAAKDFEGDIRAALESQWVLRVKQIWETRLQAIVELARVKISEGAEEIRSGQAVADLTPEDFRFSELPYPPTPHTMALAQSTSLTTFYASLKKRSSGRTPLLDSTLSSIEAAAQALRADMSAVPNSLHADYEASAREALRGLEAALRDTLSAFQTTEDGPLPSTDKAVDAALFVGRAAIYLAKGSTFFDDLVGGSSLRTGLCIERMLEIHVDSTRPWRARSVAQAVLLLSPIFSPHNGPTAVRVQWQGPHPTQPSAPFMVALQSLVGSVRLLGAPRGSELGVVKDLVIAFVGQVRGLEGWSGLVREQRVQAAFDLAFLDSIEGKPDQGGMAREMLKDLPEDVSSDFPKQLPDLVADYLRRTQLLIHPLIAHLSPSALPDSFTQPSKLDRNAALLRLGPPNIARSAGAGASEFRSPLAVAKPGKRFGLISIAV